MRKIQQFDKPLLSWRRAALVVLDEKSHLSRVGIEESSAMRRGELADLTAFVAVADNLSFRAAAARLGVTPSALSHTVRQLEERVGVRLLNRTTRSVSPTDAGRRLLERLRPAIDQIAGALDDLNGERSRPFGRLRIYATHLAGAAVLAPVWARFLSTYPDVDLEVALEDASTDIVARGFDAGIGSRDLAAADMVAVRVMAPMKVAVVGAPGYFARRRRLGCPMISSTTNASSSGGVPTDRSSTGRSNGVTGRGAFRSRDD
jgi:DNA-binding transcriptional LysR family regulator